VRAAPSVRPSASSPPLTMFFCSLPFLARPPRLPGLRLSCRGACRARRARCLRQKGQPEKREQWTQAGRAPRLIHHEKKAQKEKRANATSTRVLARSLAVVLWVRACLALPAFPLHSHFLLRLRTTDYCTPFVDRWPFPPSSQYL